MNGTTTIAPNKISAGTRNTKIPCIVQQNGSYFHGNRFSPALSLRPISIVILIWSVFSVVPFTVIRQVSSRRTFPYACSSSIFPAISKSSAYASSAGISPIKRIGRPSLAYARPSCLRKNCNRNIQAPPRKCLLHIHFHFLLLHTARYRHSRGKQSDSRRLPSHAAHAAADPSKSAGSCSHLLPHCHGTMCSRG